MKLRKFKKVFAVAATFLLAFSSISTEALFAEEDVTKTLTAVLENMEVDLTYKEGELPEDAVLNVTATEQTKADAMLEKAKTKVEGNVIDSKTFDVSVKDAQGNDLTLTSAASLTFKNIDMQNITKVFALNGEEIEEQDAEIVEKNVDFAIKNLNSYTFVDAQKVEINASDNNLAKSNDFAESVSNSENNSNNLLQANDNGAPLSLQFDKSVSGNGKRNLQVRVYDEDSNLLQTLPNNENYYKFSDEDLKVSFILSDEYQIDSVYFDKFEGDYSKDKVKDKKDVEDNTVEIELKEFGKNHKNRNNYLDIYLKKVTPTVKGKLTIINKLNVEDLNSDDALFEQKKSYNYQVFDSATDKPYVGIISYDLYDLNGEKINGSNKLMTQNDGIIQIKANRKVAFNVAEIDAKEGHSYYIKQLNGDRYETKYSVNGGNFVVGKQSLSIDLVNNETKVTFENKRLPLQDIVYINKTASINNWSNRTYNVDLMSGYKSNEVTVKENADVIFVLDRSGSMIYTDAKVAGTGQNGKVTINDLNKDYVYFTKSLSKYASYEVENNDKTIYYGAEITNGTLKKALSNAAGNDKGGYKKNLYYGINIDSEIIFYESGQWKIAPASKQTTENTRKLSENDLESGIYTQRSTLLVDSVSKFIDGMSDDCNIGIVTFGETGREEINLTKLNSDENRTKVKNIVKNSTGQRGEGTKMHTGLNIVQTMLNKTDSQKYVIAFTDGEDSDESKAESSAETLKQNSTIFTIGAGVTEKSKTFLKKIASTPDNFLSSESMNEIYDLLEIISDQIGNAFFRGTVTDYIDPRFDLLNDDGNIASVGDIITDPNNSAIKGIVKKDNNGIYVQWMNQSIRTAKAGSYSWKATLNLKAKEDFLGGNVILTNGSESKINAANSHLGDKDLYFPKPTVNVKELDFTLKNKEITLEIGNDINPNAYIKELNQTLSRTDLQLNENELTELLNKKTLSKTYAYEGTGKENEYGELVYTLEATTDGVDKVIWNKHAANHSSNKENGKMVPVETYTLKVEYIPYGVGERSKVLTNNNSNGAEHVCEKITATGKYDVYVKGGPDVTIDKTATQTDANAREFTIDLTASSLDKIETIKAKPMDIILLLDNSGSMIGNIRLLNNSVNKFIEIVKEKSPNSRIAIITYNKNSIDYTNGFQDIKTYQYTNLKEPEIGASTNMSSAMKMAYDNYYNSSDTNFKINPEHSQILVSFTDGNNNIPIAPTYPPEFPEVSDIEDYERPDQGALRYSEYFKKNLNVVNYSIALGVPGTKGELTFDAVKFLKRIASSAEYPYYSNPKSADELESVFSNLADVIVTQHSLKNVTITDTITKEFYIPEDEIDRLIKDGASVNKNTDGTTTVTWKNQTVLYNDKEGEYGWHKKIHVVAKDDFLGGNYVPTNTEATMVYDKYTYEFPKPTVNVGTLPINITNDKHVVFKGDTINSSTCLTDLNNSINIASIRLTEDELTKLRSDGTLNKVYAYDSDTDFGKNFGKLIYTYTKSIKDDQDHKATKASTKDENGNVKESETYTLEVKYEPMTNEERINYLKETENKDLTNYTNSTNNNQIGKSSQGAHKIYVVAGELDLTKIINEQYTNEKVINSNQSFVFKITKYNEQNELVDTFYQTISFSANDEDTKLKTVKIKDLDKGYYTVEEVSDWSWKYVKTNEDDNYSQNNTSNKKIYIGDIVQDKLFGVESNTMIEDVDYSNPATSKFENKKNTTQNIVKVISDVASAINKFNK